MASILHVLAPSAFGGLESAVLALARGQIESGQTVHVGAIIDFGSDVHPFVRALESAHVPVTPIPVSSRGYFDERRAVRKLLGTSGASVVHTHGYRPDVVDSGVARALGKATVSTVHGFTGFGGFKGHFYEWLQMRWFRRFDAVVVVSETILRRLLDVGIPRERVHLIQNAWRPSAPFWSREEARAKLGLDPAAPIAGWVGRLSPEKGPEIMIRSLAACGRGDLLLSVFGTGPMESEMRALAVELGVGARVTWHGLVPDASRLLTAFDVLALTSWTEGTPMILLEGMAAGVPLVVTAVGGVPKVVSNDEALLLPPGDVDAIGNALESVLEGTEVARRRSHEARRRLERDFAVGPWVQRYRNVYDACI